MKITKVILPILILALGVSVFVYFTQSAPKRAPMLSQEKAWLVSTLAIEPQTLSPTLTLYGRVESPRDTTLRTPTLSKATTVLQRLVREGERVRAGQVLIELDARDSKLTLAQRQADVEEIQALLDSEASQHKSNLQMLRNELNLLELTKKTVERANRLKSQQVASQATLDDAQQAVERQQLALNNRRLQINTYPNRQAQLNAQLKRAQTLRDAAQLEVERTEIRSPFDGVVASIAVSEGDSVHSGETLLSLYDNTRLEVRAQIPNRFQDFVLNALAQQNELPAYVAEQNDVELMLERVSGKINRNSGGIDGLFRVTTNAQTLRLGQFLSVVLQLPPQENVIALPFSAVYGTDKVYLWQKERMHGVRIKRVGEQVKPNGDTWLLVRSEALQTDVEVITTQLPNAIEGLKVKKVDESDNT